EQDRREARDDVSAAPAHEQIVEPVPMAIREIARRVAQPLWAEAKQRGPSEPVSLSDAARIAGIDLEHEAQTWHEQEQQIDETQDGERAQPPVQGLVGSSTDSLIGQAPKEAIMQEPAQSAPPAQEPQEQGA